MKKRYDYPLGLIGLFYRGSPRQLGMIPPGSGNLPLPFTGASSLASEDVYESRNYPEV
jgi:hypothetical protein